MPSYHRYRVTYKGRYLFHCIGTDDADALTEARECSRRQAFREPVIRALVIARD